MNKKVFNLKQYIIHLSYLGIQYNGISMENRFSKSVCSTIEENLTKLLPTIKPFGVKCSSRTDKSVHAFWNTISFKTNSRHTFNINELRLRLNYNMSATKEVIRIHQVKEISPEINIISSVKSRTYLYRIAVIKKGNFWMDCLSAWDSVQFCFVGEDFDIDKFREIAKALSGKHNYCGFTNLEGYLKIKNPEKNVDIVISESSESLSNMRSHPIMSRESVISYIDVYITAESFMNKMVRFLVGCMIDVAINKISQEVALDVLNRGSYYFVEKPFHCATPFGLYLYDLKYDDENLDFIFTQWKSEMESDVNIAKILKSKEPIEILNEDVKEKMMS